MDKSEILVLSFLRSVFWHVLLPLLFSPYRMHQTRLSNRFSVQSPPLLMLIIYIFMYGWLLHCFLYLANSFFFKCMKKNVLCLKLFIMLFVKSYLILNDRDNTAVKVHHLYSCSSRRFHSKLFCLCLVSYIFSPLNIRNSLHHCALWQPVVPFMRTSKDSTSSHIASTSLHFMSFFMLNSLAEYWAGRRLGPVLL